MSSHSSPPKSLERSDSSKSSKMNALEMVNRWAALACLRNSLTIDGKHTYSSIKTNRSLEPGKTSSYFYSKIWLGVGGLVMFKAASLTSKGPNLCFNIDSIDMRRSCD